MKKNILLFIALFFSFCSFSQSTYFTVLGKIIDANTKAPMQAASVFAQNTTFGTATDADGNFKLQLPNGGYELAISYTGFQTESKRISSGDAENNNIVIELRAKEKAMEDVVIKSSSEVKDGWEKYGDFFLENFIGKTANSKLCTIKDKDNIKFYFSKKRNRLKVLASTPIQIVNEALGYNIKYALDSFTYEYNTQQSFYTGYPLFEEMQPANEAQKTKWDNNRLKTYNGSLLQLMRSIYNKQLKEDGFEIQFFIKQLENDSAFILKNFYSALNYKKDDSLKTVEILPNQQQVAVLYTKEIPEQNYLAINTDEPAKFQLSVFTFTPNQSIFIEENGYYYEQTSVTINQYLGYKKMADMLPYDYK